VGEKLGEGCVDEMRAVMESTPKLYNLSSYTKIVQSRGAQRAIIAKCNDIMAAAYSHDGRDTASLIDFCEQKIMEVSKNSAGSGNEPQFIKTILERNIDQIDFRFNSKVKIFGLQTGFLDLDNKTGGLSPGDLVIVGARPSMGKTSLLMNIVENAVLRGERVQVFSMEMPAEQLGLRIISSLSKVRSQNLRTGQIAEDEWPKLTHAIGMIGDKSLQIDDTPAQTISGIRSSARRMAAKTGGVGLVAVDYLQLMTGSSGSNRTEELAVITRGLKALANELGCPVIVLSQLNRGLEQRPNKRPVMSDLRESGAIEQDADIILFIYRDEVYNPETDQKGIAEIIISKQRNGPLGTVRLAWNGEFTRFENYANPNYSRQV
jgi:replicative DNA helicase